MNENTSYDNTDSDNSSKEMAIKAAVLDRLLQHLDKNKDVQNIELMILAGFCRNCLANWWQEAAENQGLKVDKDTAREKIYGMPYAEWKTRYQKPATEEQLKAFTTGQKSKEEMGSR